MCSFDVCSLFTNAPLDETIEISLTKLYSLPDPPSLPRHVLKDLLLFVKKKSHLVFDGDYYDQIDRVAMGSILFYFISFAQKNTKAKHKKKKNTFLVRISIKKESGRAVFLLFFNFLLHASFTYYYLLSGICWSSWVKY